MPPSKSSLPHRILHVTRFTPSLSCIYVNYHFVCQTVWSSSLLSLISVMSIVCLPFQYQANLISATCVFSTYAISTFLFVIPSLHHVKIHHCRIEIMHYSSSSLPSFHCIISYMYHHCRVIFAYPLQWSITYLPAVAYL